MKFEEMIVSAAETNSKVWFYVNTKNVSMRSQIVLTHASVFSGVVEVTGENNFDMAIDLSSDIAFDKEENAYVIRTADCEIQVEFPL